jgi:hypothetical protein
LQSCCRTTKHIAKDIKYIPEGAIWEDYHTIPENNLLQYLKTYSNDKVDNAKETYVGTSKDGGTFFWEINTGLQVQKAKNILL